MKEQSQTEAIAATLPNIFQLNYTEIFAKTYF